jgi:ABC-type nitrate/sulfonate/bicarbonate transport system substrate-binding protein
MKRLGLLFFFTGLFFLKTAGAEEITLLTTVLRVVNVPMLAGLRLLEKEDGIKITVKELRTPEAVVLAVIDGQGQVGTGFAPFYPAVEKGAPIKGVIEMSRPEFVISAKQEIKTIEGLNGARLASHSPKSTVQSLVEFWEKDHPSVKPNIVFIPEGSPARASALLRGAVDAAAFDLTSAKTVSDSAPGKFHILVDFTTQPVSSSILFFNPAFAKANPQIVQKAVARMVESHRRGAADPKFWVRERGDALKGVDDAKLEEQLRDVVKIVDPNGGIDRLQGAGAAANLSFQVTAGSLTGPESKWKAEQFYDTGPLQAALKQLGRK